MVAVLLALTLSLLVMGCASATPTPLSLTALLHLQIRQHAGFVAPSWDVPGDSHARQFNALTAWAEGENIIVTVADLSRRHLRGSVQHGYGGWVILLHQDSTPNTLLHTLLHELGHIYGPKAPREEEREVIAEMVAALTCQQLGLDVWPQTAGYLGSRVSDRDLQMRTVQLHAVAIDAAVAKLTEAIKRYLEKKQP